MSKNLIQSIKTLKNTALRWGSFLVSGVLALVLPALVHAQSIQSASDVSRVVERIAQFLSSLLLSVSVVVIIIAGFMYLSAGGNEKRVEQATKTITYAMVGIIVGILAYSVPRLITNILR